MKIRHGFVSNSSTTSFCIYGMLLSTEGFKDRDDVENLAESAGLETHGSAPYGYDEDGVYVGLYPGCGKPEETFQEFYDRVKGLISKTFNIEDPQCCWHTDGWYDG